ncbi:hypothetical protein M9Y10_045169 [Tritrichomonas musculus]|uniref:Phosphoprotein phosphatase n=1 Tax=Tritrichomonas musculus TaxID=1915356 RepID=A0ABR2JWC9_9EUKA
MFVSRRQFLSIRQPSLQPLDRNHDSNSDSENKNTLYNSTNKDFSSSLPGKTSQARIINPPRSSFSSTNKCILVPSRQKFPNQSSSLRISVPPKSSSQTLFSTINVKNSVSSPFGSKSITPLADPTPTNDITHLTDSTPENSMPIAEDSNFTVNADTNDLQSDTSDFPEKDPSTIESNIDDQHTIEQNSTVEPIITSKTSIDENPECQQSPSVSSSSFESSIRQKLDICTQICDFSMQKNNMPEKELKSHTLFELVELFEHSSQIQNIDVSLQNDIFKMIEANIFNPNRIRKVIISDYSFTFLEPSWSHLFYCYQIFNKFLQLFPNSELITKDLMKRILFLTELPDNNERTQLVTLLRTYYNSHPKEHLLIIKAVESFFIDLLDQQVPHFCAMPLLQLSAYLFSKSRYEYPNDINRLIKSSIIPLIGLKYLPFFQQSLKNFISVVLAAYPSMAMELLRGIELRWPITNGTKQQQILEILIMIFSKMPQDAFKLISKRVFKFLADCLLSNHLKTIETVLDVWNNADENNWIVINSRTGIKEMYENTAYLSEKHWNSQVVSKANLALAAMNRLNKNTLQKIKAYYKQLKSQKFREKPPNDIQKAWNLIAQKASSNGADFDLTEKMARLRELFHNEKRPTLEMSRFIPVKKKDIEESQKAAKGLK